jgi:hypothetical protein
VLLNVVNTTGEYLIARLLHPPASPGRRRIPASTRRPTSARSSASYQFWVNVVALCCRRSSRRGW